MIKFISYVLLASATLAAPAMAQTSNSSGIAGSIGGGFEQGSSSTFNQNGGASGTFNGSGNTVGSSASGFNTTMGGTNGGAQFESNGLANSSTSVTPFSISTESSHEGFSTGSASPNAAFSASTQTFGQSNGASAFNLTTSANYNFSTAESQFQTGNLGFSLAGFESYSDYTPAEDNHPSHPH